MIRNLAAAAAAAAFCASLFAQTVVSPQDRLNLEGSSFTHFPLGRASIRMQTLHQDLPPGAVLNGHAYRADATTLRSRVDTFAVDMEVTVSMAARTPATASTTFATNVGATQVVVLPRTVVSFPATDRPLMDPAPTFEFQIPWQVPFMVPLQGGTVCLDVRVWGNFAAAGNNRNFSVYEDAHMLYTDGRNEQPGYRFGQGCMAPGQSSLPYATFTLFNLGTGMQLDAALRNGVLETGTDTLPLVVLGLSRTQVPWPGLPGCAFLTSNELWWAMAGHNDAQGNFDGSIAWPLLPPGHRLYLQSGSLHLGTGALAFGDGSTLVTPGPGPLPIPVVRIANSTDGAALTGTVSTAVPVTRFL
jgi:hypothetical protein